MGYISSNIEGDEMLEFFALGGVSVVVVLALVWVNVADRKIPLEADDSAQQQQW